MKQALLLSITLVFNIGLWSSCSEEEQVNSADRAASKDIVLEAGETFTYDLGSNVSFEGGYSISRQAEHFAVSEIQYDNASHKYVYEPKAGFKGKDSVDLYYCVSTGAPGCTSSKYFTFNFTIK